MLTTKLINVLKIKTLGMLLFSIITMILLQLVLSDDRCVRQPEGHVTQKSPSDGRFRLRIEGNPEEYTPGLNYTVVLQGIKSHGNAHAFIGFMIVVEKASSDQFLNTGRFFLIGDSLSKFSDRCTNAVTQTSALQKRDIRVIWNAPLTGNGCVVFRATVVEHRDVWYMDDDHLVKTFCKDEQDIVEKQPIIQDPCKTCDEARYEMKFERIWSRYTHPKDFPSDSLSTRFSDIIGASHAANYRFWEYGKYASFGLKQLAEHGSTREIEAELKMNIEQIRTIIKARGVTQANATGKSFAVFRVDSKNHLISLASMIDPSPDWIVGVFGLELCREDGSWVENKTIKLFPWDAGTDSGQTYLSPDQPTDPLDVLRRITPTSPNDLKSPFFDETDVEMKPLALLHITRQIVYEKICEGQQGNEDNIITTDACDTTPWGEWHECNVRCGPGKRKRVRQYLDSVRAEESNCIKKLQQSKHCIGKDINCDDTNNGNSDMDSNSDVHVFEPGPQNDDHECELTDWTPWTSCSISCGKGVRTRDRQYKIRSAKYKCQTESDNPPELQDTEECNVDSCEGDLDSTNAIDIDTRKCKTGKWTDWSPCSVTCGIGEKMRSRKLRGGGYQTSAAGSGPCAGVKLVQVVQCEQPSCESYGRQPDRCRLPIDKGSCSNKSNRYGYNVDIDDCAIFFYHGCSGNENNFETYETCRNTCRLAYT